MLVSEVMGLSTSIEHKAYTTNYFSFRGDGLKYKARKLSYYKLSILSINH